MRGERPVSWRPVGQWRRSVVPAELRPWLLDTGSLTRRLRLASGGDFSVRVLARRWERPRLDERRRLGLPDRAVALVRQVQLLCHGRPVVYARTVLPRTALRGSVRRLARLGGKPLGEMLFRDSTMRRGVTEIGPVTTGDGLEWGRRTVYHLRGQRLLVSEIFLPPLLARPRSRWVPPAGRRLSKRVR